MNEIFLDTETTGLSFLENHKIVEIACIETKDLIPTKNYFHQLINPQRNVPPEAYKIHGYSTEFLKDKKVFKEIAEQFQNFIKDKKIIIHNAEFDISHLNNELKLIGRPTINLEDVIDTLEIAREKYPGSQISLDALCKRFRIDNSRRKFHTALIDCNLLSKVYVNLIDQKEPKLDFVLEDTKNLQNFQKANYCKKIIEPTKEEFENYKAFIKKALKKNI